MIKITFLFYCFITVPLTIFSQTKDTTYHVGCWEGIDKMGISFRVIIDSSDNYFMRLKGRSVPFNIEKMSIIDEVVNDKIFFDYSHKNDTLNFEIIRFQANKIIGRTIGKALFISQNTMILSILEPSLDKDRQYFDIETTTFFNRVN